MKKRYRFWKIEIRRPSDPYTLVPHHHHHPFSHKFIINVHIFQLYRKYKSIVCVRLDTAMVSFYYSKRGFMCQVVLKIVTH